ncbi:uncharacterized protein J3D65DRAFT_63288 [Phyllosticta citribraziliensis]|uniref:Uncharacterized protein n=1 Tax=Phyllosticta citribraziliensis TaxID=989973 RepID=A0ABR1LCN8_9PEZI
MPYSSLIASFYQPPSVCIERLLFLSSSSSCSPSISSIPGTLSLADEDVLGRGRLDDGDGGGDLDRSTSLPLSAPLSSSTTMMFRSAERVGDVAARAIGPAGEGGGVAGQYRGRGRGRGRSAPATASGASSSLSSSISSTMLSASGAAAALSSLAVCPRPTAGTAPTTAPLHAASWTGRNLPRRLMLLLLLLLLLRPLTLPALDCSSTAAVVIAGEATAPPKTPMLVIPAPRTSCAGPGPRRAVSGPKAGVKGLGAVQKGRRRVGNGKG